MNSRHFVIYVPGLGDHQRHWHNLTLKFWQLFGVRVATYKIYWKDSRPFNQKLDGLLARIDELHDQGYLVSLVGTSAGASAAINAYVRRMQKVHRVVFICGKLQNIDVISPAYFRRNPSFETSVKMVHSSISILKRSDKAKMLSLQPLADGIVPPNDTKIAGVKNRRIFAVGHIFSIGVAEIFYAPSFLKFIKN